MQRNPLNGIMLFLIIFIANGILFTKVSFRRRKGDADFAKNEDPRAKKDIEFQEIIKPLIKNETVQQMKNFRILKIIQQLQQLIHLFLIHGLNILKTIQYLLFI